MHCQLLIPGLLPSARSASNLLQGVSLPALDLLLARAGQTRVQPGDMAAWLCREFGVEQQGDWPVAPFTLLAHGGNPGSAYWLQAEPAHLQLQGDRMILVEIRDIGADEPAALTEALNLHFAQDGLVFQPTQPGHWHLRLALPPRLETHPADAVIGRNIRHLLPHGPDSAQWHRLLNEIQMLLHDHPVNRAREQSRKLPVNTIWPWGGGVLPQKIPAHSAQVWASHPLASGLAIAAGARLAGTPDSAGDWLQQAVGDTHLIVLDDLRSAALGGDLTGWQNGLLQLEKNWFAPLSQALRQGKISRLTLRAPGENGISSFSVSRTDLWKFWRRKAFRDLILEKAV